MTGRPGRVRVLVADDHRLFRDGVRALLAVTDDVEVVGEASTADAAVELGLALRPDVVLMDLQMPGGGLEATSRLADGAPEVAVLVLTMFSGHDSVLAAVRAGARGYVLKDSEAEDLLRAVRAAASGDAIFGGAVAGSLLAQVSGRGGAAPRPQPFEALTPGERGVLRVLARGATNAAIARELSLSEKTVRNYVSAVFHKLGVTDRAQAVVAARRAGLHREDGGAG